MPRFRQTAEILKLMSKKENIRNIGVVAHIDHGKTTMTDSLLAGAGLLSPQIAGKARALDYLEEEQKRGITIKTANISLLHETRGHQYVINLIDTPGHVDFTGKVTRALRAIDGVIVVVDAVEEVMVQTETVTSQALEERVKPVLFINKFDRLIRELRLSEDEIQKKFARIISDFNNLIEIYAEPEFKDQWKVDPVKETVAFGSALHQWGFTLNIAKQKKIKMKEIVEAYRKAKFPTLRKEIPLYNAILDMVVKNLPSPAEAQRYRIPKIWKGKIDSEIGQAMLKCEDNGPTVMCIIMTQADSNAGLLATGRLFSGSIKEGDKVYLVNADREYCVQQVSMYMGAYREIVNKITAGNITALLSLELARAGETLVDAEHKKVMVPFERIKYVSEPVMTVAVEPKNPSDLPCLLEAMNRLSTEDPNLLSTVNKETGEYLLSGMGELHLEIAVKFLKEYAGEVEITTSQPMVVYRESVEVGGVIVTAKSLNKQNKFVVQVEPLDEKVKELIEKDEIKAVGNILALDEHGNILIDAAEWNKIHIEANAAIISAFRSACKAGPLCGEPLRDVTVKLIDVQLHENPLYHYPVEVLNGARKAIFGSFLTAKPVLLEPIYRISVSVSPQHIGECLNIITCRRGKVLASEQKGMLMIVSGYIPVAETFGLSEEMRSATSGQAFWQSAFDHWEKVPESVATELIRRIRERKGLPIEVPKPSKFIDEPLKVKERN
jgi:elongation factor 2